MTNNTLDVNVRLGCGTLPGSCFAIDPFLCYATRTTVGTAAFVPVNGVDLVTATESRQFDAIRRGRALHARQVAPTTSNEVVPHDATEPKATGGAPRPAPRARTPGIPFGAPCESCVARRPGS
ncbi:MAG TPA: hypothetical protein VJ144_10575 [Candidatus Polarisedimenticolia bacterium]|nr:hypothetical protein [Candidatus Polarisedimenticolia bacterium]